MSVLQSLSVTLALHPSLLTHHYTTIITTNSVHLLYFLFFLLNMSYEALNMFKVNYALKHKIIKLYSCD